MSPARRDEYLQQLVADLDRACDALLDVIGDVNVATVRLAAGELFNAPRADVEVVVEYRRGRLEDAASAVSEAADFLAELRAAEIAAAVK
jgi:hypothetical protein